MDTQKAETNQMDKKKALIKKRVWVKKRFHPIIVELMGGLDVMCSYPELPWKDDYCGLDYIDQIPDADVTHPIMIGEDGRGRAFIVFKAIRASDEDAITHQHVLFQRNPDDPLTWADASNIQNGGESIFRNANGGYWLSKGRLDDVMAEGIQKFIAGNGDFKHYCRRQNREIMVNFHFDLS